MVSLKRDTIISRGTQVVVVVSIASITQYDVLIPVCQAITHYAVCYFSRSDL